MDKKSQIVRMIVPALGKEIVLPLICGTEGPSVIDIRSLYKETGLFTYDPGFMSTASCSSDITYIDGNQGILRYRGYDINELAEGSSFVEVAHLLLYGELPTQEEYPMFNSLIKKHTMVHEQVHFLYRGFPRHSHPMAIMVGAIASLSAFYHDYLNVKCEKDREISAIRIIAKIPTLAAMAYKYSIGQPFVYPDNSLDYSANFLKMMFAVPAEEYEVDPVIVKALDKLLILHADHEQNASTSAVRIAGSSGANPFAVIGAGIASLWGPAHGGANEAVIKMLEEIKHPSRIQGFIEKAKDKNEPFKLMGFGHRVYKNYDPRAAVLKNVCFELLNTLKIERDALLDIALKLEEVALTDPYFIEKKLYPNVDFYSGIIYKIIGIPVQMYTVMFAVARATGWVAQWCEMMKDPDQKIGRPRQLYKGKVQRPLMLKEGQQ